MDDSFLTKIGPLQRCRKVMKSGGGQLFLFRFRGVWGHAPQKCFGCFRALTASGAI